MNIFKILSSGDQKLKEPAVTSFLAFLLDPYESHGLKTNFLEYFLKPIVEHPDNYETYKDLVFKKKDIANKKKDVIKLKSNLIYDFDFKIEIEVSKSITRYDIIDEEQNEANEKSNDKKRNDIDIVIEIVSKDNDNTKYLFIIENKINDGALNGKNGEQLKKQRESLMDELERKEEELNSKVCSIFLTPQTDSSMKYFEAFKNGIERKNEMDSPKNTVYHKPISYHHYWKAIEETKESDMGKYKNTEEVASSIVGVYNFLNDILSKESVGLIEPIQDYTKHTIKAFMNFIDSGFKSKKDESVTSKKNYYETIDEIFAIWDINDENKALANKIISELQNENIILAKTESLISIKKQMNICGIFKPPKTIKSSIPCFIKYNSTHSYDSDYKLAKDGFYRVNVNNNNIDKFIQNARDLIGMTNK